jgi:hypothetical protein
MVLPAEARRSGWGGAADLPTSLVSSEVRRRRSGCAEIKLMAAAGLPPVWRRRSPLAAATCGRWLLVAWCGKARRRGAAKPSGELDVAAAVEARPSRGGGGGAPAVAASSSLARLRWA